jgi:hypothetical protein
MIMMIPDLHPLPPLYRNPWRPNTRFRVPSVLHHGRALLLLRPLPLYVHPRALAKRGRMQAQRTLRTAVQSIQCGALLPVCADRSTTLHIRIAGRYSSLWTLVPLLWVLCARCFGVDYCRFGLDRVLFQSCTIVL